MSTKAKPIPFVHLHNHSEYSFLDGAISVVKMVERAQEFGMPSLAITDHGGMFGAVEFYVTCLAHGIKPILGFEAYVAPESRFDKTYTKDEHSANHLILLARNKEGYKNLMKLSTIGYREGFYYKPRIDLEVLRQCSGGIIASSACIAGAIPRALLAGNRVKARELAQTYAGIFGEGNFYLELQNHGIDEELVVFDEMVKLGNELGLPFIVTNDAHYLNHDDALSHEVLLCIQTQTTMDDPKRYRFSSDQIYFKSPAEMAALFPDIPEALKNTVTIAERCNVDIKEKAQLPVSAVPEGVGSPEEYLEQLARHGLRERYAHVTPGLEERLKFELKTICSMGFAGYFIIVRDFVQAAEKMGVMVGCRGSVAGSLVSFALGISRVDPIKFDLIFERFLNPERISMPDADIDIADRDRHKVIEYVIEKYGRDSVCQIINFGRMKAKMVVKDVARAMGIAVADANRISNLITEDTLEKSIKANGELKQLIDNSPQYQQVFKHAATLEGLARQAGMHAGGVIIAPGNVVDWAPLYKQQNTDILMTQYDMKYVEKVGLIKMDLLGLRTLTVLQETLRLVKSYHNQVIDLWKIPDGDKKTYELFGKGETTGVFQFESQGMQDYLRKLKPERVEDLIAMNALYRPGPMENIDTYIRRKHGKEKVEFLHPNLKDVLEVTYGVIIYQEQVMRIAQAMAGFTLGQADILRKAMSKKDDKNMEEMGKSFVDGAQKRGIEKAIAQNVFNFMAPFAKYGFNKAHAAVYAHIAYQSAFLKSHFPIEFLTASLTSQQDDQEKFLVVRNEAERMGIKLLPPDVNISEFDCMRDGESIRMGLGAIKNVGKAAESVLAARKGKQKFTSIFDLCAEVDLRLVNKKCLESLVCAGAMDSLRGTRAQLFAAIDRAIEYGNGVQQEKRSGQTNLFQEVLPPDSQAQAASALPEPVLGDVPPWPYNELLAKEKEVLSFYVSGHPLDRYVDEIRGFTSLPLKAEALTAVKEGATLTVGGLITGLRSHLQRDGRQMAFLKLEDFDGAIELLAFGDAYEKFRHLLAADAMILVNGKVAAREAGSAVKLRVENVMALSDARAKLTRSVHIRMKTQGLEDSFVQEIFSLCETFAGETPLVLHCVTHDGNEYQIRAKKGRVNPGKETIEALRGKLGKENVWLSRKTAG